EAKVVDNITEYNNRIKEINIKVKQFKDSEKSIRYKIWGAIRELCNAEFEAFSKYENDDKIIYEQYQLELNAIKEQGDNNNKKIKELRDQISNIDATIDSINQRLKLLGIYGFSIKKHTESNDKYIISRSENTTDKDVYRSLSEGEKTLITFLYFLECCKGKTDKNDTDMRDVFIVIDDPISSLSQNYVYDIASIIHHEIINNNKAVKKTLILTHNLYFFHELIKLAPRSKEDRTFKRDYYLGRITKNEYSIITEIEKKSIQNEYQSLWQVLKDAKDGRVNKVIIPNIMRNILEYYFAFVHRTDALQTELNKLASDDKNNDFRAFYRYINRGSHSDAVNITDMGDISPEKYMEQLKTIFRMTGDEKHYLKMIDEEEEETVTA
ncbi:AAA family ATPase, partial [Salmonella enterica subsp. enterica serovar Infantis]|nr:AAA family ATPase [Salmonella enterica subsp. enterica serovar Infantis]